MRKRKSVILLSGGLDSSANLAFAREFDEPVLVLTADYGQKAAVQEIAAAQKLSRHYDVLHQVIDLTWLGKLGGSALTSKEAGPVPRIQVSELDQSEVTRKTAQAVWVPNRNGVLINTGAAFAERIGAERVVVGFNIEEAATFPDNSIEFMDKSSASLSLSTANGVEVYSYTSTWDKKKIVTELKALKPAFPFELIWSCYHGDAAPCGNCESCQRFQRAMGNG